MSEQIEVPRTFVTEFRPQWSDMDQNGHMRTTAYLAAAENSRMQYFAACGFPMSEFVRHGFGPVVQSDELRYRAELRLLQPAELALQLVSLAADGKSFSMRNTFTRLADGKIAATVTTGGGWLDLRRRQLIAPPDDLLGILAGLSRADDAPHAEGRER
jgi:acyl-CoA thioester hydrolase